MTEAAAPAPHLWHAPAHWKSIDFVSDLHLSPALARTTQAFVHYLAHTRSDCVCLLGDVFELWVGDDSRHQPFERGLVEALAGAAAGGRALAYMHGNRDFLVGDDLCRAAGLTLLPDPTCLVAWGRRWLLSHGDALCLADHAYQAFRSQVRSPEWQRGFLAQPLERRLEQARAMRRASMDRHRLPAEGTGDLDPEACGDWLARANSMTLVHGHTHRPARHALAGGRERWVLSDWDLDGSDAAGRAQVLRLHPDGSLVRLSPAEACSRP